MHKYKFSGFNHSILHFVTEKEDYLHNQWLDIISKIISSEMSQKNMQYAVPDLEELFYLGAIYLNEIRLVNSAYLRHEPISEGQLLRFHLQPRRYTFSWVQLFERIIYEDQDILILDKPAGIPVHPTVDNQIENLVYQLSKHHMAPIMMVHRLDLETQGLILFTKNKDVNLYFSELFASRNIKKTYTVIISKSGLSPGLKTHWMINSQRAPKKISESNEKESKICELIIHQINKITNPIVLARFQLDFQKTYYAANIELLTGRTHQIRAQLAFLGFPIVGDQVYGGDTNPLLGLQSSCIEFEDPQTKQQRLFQHPLFKEIFL